MEGGLLVVERMILEILLHRSRTLEQLSWESGIRVSGLKNVLEHLKSRRLIKKVGEFFCLNCEYLSQYLQILSSPDGVKREVVDVVRGILDLHFRGEGIEPNLGRGGQMKLKKMWLSPRERDLFEVVWDNMERFITREVGRSSRRKSPMRDQSVVIWGHCRYGELVAHEMND
jgi:hypothetical protein